MAGPAVGQAMDEPWVAVESKNDRLVGREERIELAIRKPVRMVARRLQRHQINHIDDSHLKLRNMSSQKIDGCQGFQCGDIPAAGHYHVRFTALVIGSPFPDS